MITMYLKKNFLIMEEKNDCLHQGHNFLKEKLTHKYFTQIRK